MYHVSTGVCYSPQSQRGSPGVWASHEGQSVETFQSHLIDLWLFFWEKNDLKEKSWWRWNISLEEYKFKESHVLFCVLCKGKFLGRLQSSLWNKIILTSSKNWTLNYVGFVYVETSHRKVPSLFKVTFTFFYSKVIRIDTLICETSIFHLDNQFKIPVFWLSTLVYRRL